jgi:hypothetical protein
LTEEVVSLTQNAYVIRLFCAGEALGSCCACLQAEGFEWGVESLLFLFYRGELRLQAKTFYQLFRTGWLSP